MAVGVLALAASVLASTSVAAEQPAPLVQVRVTQKDLLPCCLDGVPTRPDARSWRLAVGAHTLAFSMRSKTRHASPGVALVSFALEAGHKYEVEVRASPMAFSSRVWQRGEWKPVVRDRTLDRIVSGEAKWRDSGCE
jgi:hypothetical protein